MRIIIGYGNRLRGEDGFGCDVLEELKKYELTNTKLLYAFQLTPEICLELLDASEIIFIDACYLEDTQFHYNLGCSLENQNRNLSHHISPQMIIELLKSIYHKNPNYCIYGMFTNQFNQILSTTKYTETVNKVCYELEKRGRECPIFII